MIDYLKKLDDTRECRENEFFGEDGLIYCSICKKPKQAVAECKTGSFKHKKLCDCELEKARQEEKKYLDAENAIKIIKLSSYCFDSRDKLLEYTFENSKKSNSAMTLCYNYCAQWDNVKENNLSLLLCGSVGSGKTYLACSICNKLIRDRKLPVKFISEYSYINAYASAKDKQEYLNSFSKYQLIVFDDFGSKCFKKNDDSNGWLSFVFDLIDLRYVQEKPMVFTTNLSKEIFTNENYNSIDKQRVFSRLREMTGVPIEVKSKDYRKNNAVSKVDLLRNLA